MTTSNSKLLSVDTPAETTLGNQFVAPAGWSVSITEKAAVLEPPETGSRIVIVDVHAESDQAALLEGWKAYKKIEWPLKISNELADSNGWSKRRYFEYQTSPNEKRTVSARVMFANNIWTVAIYDCAHDVGGRRSAQVNLVLSSLLPKGYFRETFAGNKANKLNDTRIAELTAYIEQAIDTTGVPGVALGLIQDNNIVFSGGFGVRELGKKEEVDNETLFMVASNTKPMTTLLLAKLVDAGKLTWDTKVTDLLPTFKLGNEDTTERTLVKHLVSASTGLPRKDMEFLFNFANATPTTLMERLAETQPTTEFGELFQYSNSLPAAAGFVAGHTLFPNLELGAAYDKAMQTEVFDPLAMTATTFDFPQALSANHASPHGISADGIPSLVDMSINYCTIHNRPAGAAWSHVNDMLAYIQMELNEGTLLNGTQYISPEPLLERRNPMVSISDRNAYGMGLMIDKTYDTPVVHHGGALFGYHSDMIWLPEHGVGAVVLTNGAPGWLIQNGFRRKLLEVLFDGKPQADLDLSANIKLYFAHISANRKLYTLPAPFEITKQLATCYSNESLGSIHVIRHDSRTYFDFGEWQSEVATKKNPDSTFSLVTIAPAVAGFASFEFVIAAKDHSQLILRDAQHEYLFTKSERNEKAIKTS